MAKTQNILEFPFYQIEILHNTFALLLSNGKPSNFSDQSDLSQRRMGNVWQQVGKTLNTKFDFYSILLNSLETEKGVSYTEVTFLRTTLRFLQFCNYCENYTQFPRKVDNFYVQWEPTLSGFSVSHDLHAIV